MNSFGNKQFRVLRGYREGAVTLDIPVDSAANFQYGDAVTINSAGKVVKAANASGVVGFALNDSDEPNAKAIGKVTVLFSNFVAQTQLYNKASSYAPGTNLTVKGGVLDVAGSGDTVVGQVLYVDPVNGLVFIVR